MITIGSSCRLQRLHRLQILTGPHQRGRLTMPGGQKTLMRKGFTTHGIPMIGYSWA